MAEPLLQVENVSKRFGGLLAVDKASFTAEVGRIDDVVFHRYPDFDLLMLVYHCRLDGTPRPVEVAELAWVAPRDLLKYELLPADLPLCERLARDSS